jgi:Flp pilus assembly protein TadG
MVEFALITPTFFLLVFGIVEFGILMFDVASSRFAAGEAARAEAYAGNTSQPCVNVDGCTTLHPAAFACDADCQAVMAVRRTPVGTTSLETVLYIEIHQFTCNSSGTCSATAKFNRKDLNDNFIINAYPSSGRSVVFNQPEYLTVTIHYRYDWKTAILAHTAQTPVLDASYLVRLEPQRF